MNDRTIEEIVKREISSIVNQGYVQARDMDAMVFQKLAEAKVEMARLKEDCIELKKLADVSQNEEIKKRMASCKKLEKEALDFAAEEMRKASVIKEEYERKMQEIGQNPNQIKEDTIRECAIDENVHIDDLMRDSALIENEHIDYEKRLKNTCLDNEKQFNQKLSEANQTYVTLEQVLTQKIEFAEKESAEIKKMQDAIVAELKSKYEIEISTLADKSADEINALKENHSRESDVLETAYREHEAQFLAALENSDKHISELESITKEAYVHLNEAEAARQADSQRLTDAYAHLNTEYQKLEQAKAGLSQERKKLNQEKEQTIKDRVEIADWIEDFKENRKLEERVLGKKETPVQEALSPYYTEMIKELNILGKYIGELAKQRENQINQMTINREAYLGAKRAIDEFRKQIHAEQAAGAKDE